MTSFSQFSNLNILYFYFGPLSFFPNSQCRKIVFEKFPLSTNNFGIRNLRKMLANQQSKWERKLMNKTCRITRPENLQIKHFHQFCFIRKFSSHWEWFTCFNLPYVSKLGLIHSGSSVRFLNSMRHKKHKNLPEVWN